MWNVRNCYLDAKGDTQVETLQEFEYQCEVIETDDPVVVMKAL